MSLLRPFAACLISASVLAPAVAAAEDESPPLSIYGFARLDVLLNDSRMSSLADPSYVMNEPSSGQLDSELTMTPRLSRVGLSIDRWDIKDDKITGEGKVEIDFAGGGGVNAIRLRHAYAQLSAMRHERGAELLAGQTWDLASPLFPSAQNDTQLRYAGNLGDRRPQLRLALHPSSKLQLAVAAAAPAVLDPQDLDGDGEVDTMTPARPMLQWLAEFKTRLGRHDDGLARIGISGHAARAELADGTARPSSSVGVHFLVPFSRQVIILGEGYYGTNLAEIGGGIGNSINMATRQSVHAIGGWLELALLPTERHMLSVGTSVDVARAEDLEAGDRERNGTIYSVLRYKPRPALQLGLEHLYWKTEYKGMSRGVANRMNMHFSVFF
ncbi:MAG TPA: hypothetical protein VNO30_27445 [Kofleriaceae bacterium]|nr:hypothetical protein [Kofleriaceae bacterium]